MFVTTLLAVSLAAPVPKAKAAELYFPTVEGTKRVMQMKTGDQTSETTDTISKVVEKDGKYTVTTNRDLGGVGGRAIEFKYEVSAKGVFAVSNPNGDLAEPQPLLKLPAKDGDTWTIQRPGPGGGAKDVYTVGKEEEVEVPAGKFKAIPIVGEDALKNRATTWYAVGVGAVKVVSMTGGTELVQELKEFTPGKAK